MLERFSVGKYLQIKKMSTKHIYRNISTEVADNSTTERLGETNFF